MISWIQNRPKGLPAVLVLSLAILASAESSAADSVATTKAATTKAAADPATTSKPESSFTLTNSKVAKTASTATAKASSPAGKAPSSNSKASSPADKSTSSSGSTTNTKTPPQNAGSSSTVGKTNSAGSTTTPKASSSKPSTGTAPITSKPNTSKTASIKKAPVRISRPPAAKPKIPATVAADGAPIWLDVNSARIAAAAKKKMIVTDFYTEWCHWCKVMDKTTFKDPEIQKLLAAKFVCMRADAQDGGAGQELATRLSVTGFPTIIVFRSTGKPLAITEGYRDKAQFLEFLKKVSAPGFDPSRP